MIQFVNLLLEHSTYMRQYFMLRPKKIALIINILWAVSMLFHTQIAYSESRGELLYSIHCKSCHTSVVHWREKKLATNWSSLKAQVIRWQDNAGLSWTDEEIAEVTFYLNATYYHFSVTNENDLAEIKKLNL